VVIVQGMFLRDLVPQPDITSIAALRQRLGLTKRYAWLLWHGELALSADMMHRLYGELGVPHDLEDLPSLAPELPALSIWAYPRPRRDAAQETGLSLATSPEACPCPIAQVLAEDVWPEETS
jgi:Domain of unknown function DUF29